MTDPLAASFDALLETLSKRAAWLLDHPFCSDAENRPGAYQYLIGTLISVLEEEVIYDPDFPTFWIVDPRIRVGGDNADQRYLITRLNGGDTYRIWGRLGTERRLEFQTYAGDPWSNGRAAGFLTHEELEVATDGHFEVIASPEPEPRGRNWIENPPDGTKLIVRQTYTDWVDKGVGEVHIDRIGHEGDLKPVLSADVLAERLRAATARIDFDTRQWPEMVRRLYIDARPSNQLSEPVDPGAAGGVAGRFMVFGAWELGADEALVVKAPPTNGNYQGIQLNNLWWSSLEYANRQTSLTGDQAKADIDGSYTFVIAAKDPGIANWLDTTGLSRGIVMLRYDGMRVKEFPQAQRPTAQVIRLDELDKATGSDTPRTDQTGRRASIAARRRHVQVRFGT